MVTLVTLEKRKVELDRLRDEGKISAREYETLLELAREDVSEISSDLPRGQEVATHPSGFRRPNAKVLGVLIAIVVLLVVLISRSSKDPTESNEFLKLVERQEKLISQKGVLEGELAELEEKLATPTGKQKELDDMLQKVTRWELAVTTLKTELGK
jgi:hypothetical protein